MKFLRSLLGKDKDDKVPAWDVKPASERPPRRRGESLPVANANNVAIPNNATSEAPKAPGKAKGKAPKKDPNPFLDDPMLDTMTLEVDLTSEEDNPYSTHSWSKTPENDTRKLKTIQIGTKTEKKASGDFNPYDTGKMRRSWKR